MNEAMEIRCPVCGSNQLSANKKGFSGKKAVAGVVLTGGLGLLAGTLGSNKILITCLACGHRFKAGEGKLGPIANSQQQTSFQSTSEIAEDNLSSSTLDQIDQRILNIAQHQGLLSALKFCKDAKGWDLKTSKDYVDNLAAQHGIKGKGGCFIATACYGDYNAEEVVVLRNYRETVLLKTVAGRLFVKLYYWLSPVLAKLIAKSDRTKAFIRNHLLNFIVSKLNRQKNKFLR